MGKILFVPAILCSLVFLAFPQTATVAVDGKANIYASGRGVAFHGLVPPAVRFSPGAGRTVTFPNVGGMIACSGIAYEPLHGPDGTVNRCGGTGTNIGSWGGISGIIHRTREMFLVGVFLDEREPSDPSPDRLDFSTSENYSTLAPQIGQVFFIGDGRTSSGGLQQVTAPASATRLYLGFADAIGFSGAPYGYNDNNGELQVTVSGLTPFVPGAVATGTTMTVNGKSSIFWSGLDVNWPTELPPGWKFAAAAGRFMTVRAAGTVTCKTGTSAPPEGTSACGTKTDLEPYGSISGIKHPSRSMFLVGVFLNDLKPRGWPSAAIDFTDDNFATLSPLIGQTFYIGTGIGKQFVVPHDATRVFLGYARSDTMTGTAGGYPQAGGSLSATINLTAGSDTGVSPIQVDAKSNLYAAGREKAFDGYLPPMVRLNPGSGKVLRVPQVTGRIRCCGGGYTTADGASYQTNLNPYKGLSGIEARYRGYFLAGVFLDNNIPDGAPPPKLIFTEPFNFASLAPLIGQVFLIGDGVTSTGVPHEFTIPSAATRLYLGFAMGRLFNGDPGFYWEASDSYTATLQISGGSTPPPSCSYSLSETTRSIPATAASGSVSVTTASGCLWTASSGAAWINVVSGSAGNGPGTVSYSVTANTGSARTGAITIAGQTFTVQQAAASPGCSYTIQPLSQSASAAGGTLTVQVTAATGCAWTATSNSTWLSISLGASGTGNGSVNLSVAANTGTARTGTVTIAGLTATIQQSAASAATIEITDVVNDADLTSALAPGSTIFILGRNFATASSGVEEGLPWPNQLDGVSVEVIDGGRTLVAPIGAIANGWVLVQLPFGISASVDLRVLTGAGRSGTRTVQVQSRNPRLYTLDGSGRGHAWAFHADNNEVTPSSPARPGEEILILGTGFGAVTPPVVAGQLGIDPASGAEPNRVSDLVEVEIQGITIRPRLAILDYYLVGSYSVNFTVPEQLTTASPTLSVRVGGVASQSGVTLPVQGSVCSYSVSLASLQFGTSGGSGLISVTAPTGCIWGATSNQTWLSITAGARGSGSGTVRVTVGANTGAIRSATLTIAGKLVTISQAGAAGACTYSLNPTGFSVYHLAYRDSFQVVTEAACNWTAVSDAVWLRITGPSSATGPGRVSFEVDANPAMVERTATIRVETLTFTIRQMGAVATFEVDAKSNIFAAGRASAFNGLLPPGYRFAAGAGKVLSIDTANGLTHCQGGAPNIPADGSTFCVSGVTNVLSHHGIGGIVHGRKVMFLVGLFLDDREPADPAPARLDFTNNENYTSISPLIGQVFFLGNGRTSANAQQNVVVPETATRLFLGFADAEAFQGVPGAYQDNTGGLSVSLRVAPGGTTPPPSGGTTLSIDARSNIFASGRATAFDGLLPPSFTLGMGRVVTFSGATGTVRCSAGSAPTGADGGTECSSNGTDISGYRGISGIVDTRKTMFLVGVFLTNTEPTDPAPLRLDFSSNENFTTLNPLVGQTFFIGDGLTATGTTQQFVAPDAATRLFLGFADGYALHGSPGYYGDNSGSLSITVNAAGGGTSCTYSVTPATITALASGGASIIAVATTAACSWTATSSASWIRITSGGTASGPGALSITVDANTGAARNATVTVAGQTVTVNQAAGGSSTCTLTITPGFASFPASGGTGRIDINTQTGCSWTATATTSWIAFTGGQTGTGSGPLNYTVAANTSANNRLGTISVGGKNHPVEQAGTLPPSTVTIAAGGIVDTASFSPGLAPGSLFSIFGTDLASTTKQAASLPLPTTLEGVSVEVIDGAKTSNAPLFFVSPGQVNGQLPYDLAGTSVRMRVRNSKGDSAPATVEISPRAPRLFPWEGTNAIVVHSDYRLVTDKAPAQSSEYLIAFLVGMGAVSPAIKAGDQAGDGTVAPLNALTATVRLLVNGQASKVLYAGLSPYFVGLYQVNFQMPASLESGPLSIQVRIGEYVSQTGLTMVAGTVWSAATLQDLGPAGGVLNAGGLSLQVPAGALTTTSRLELSQGTLPVVYDGQLPEAWQLKGMPQEFRSPITVTYRPNDQSPPGLVFLIARSANGTREMRLPAVIKDGVWTATLPPRTAVATTNASSAVKSSSDREAGETVLESMIMFWAKGYEFYGDPKNRFVFFVHKSAAITPESDKWRSDTFNAALESAWDLMVQTGFGPYEGRIWRNGQPLAVWLVKNKQFDGKYKGWTVLPWLWQNEFTLMVDPDALDDAFALGDSSILIADVASLLIEMLHEPLVAKSPDWGWWSSAVSQAVIDSKTCLVTGNLRAAELKSVLTLGLEASLETQQPSPFDFGFGAATFVESLLFSGDKMATLPGEVLTQSQLGATKPSDVLRIRLAPPGLGQLWLEYTALLSQAVPWFDCTGIPAYPPPNDSEKFSPQWLKTLLEIAEKATATTRGFSKDVNLPDLSASPFLIALPKSSEVEEEMYISLTTADAEVKFFAAAVDADGKSVGEFLAPAAGSSSGRVRIPWEWRMGNQLWLWVVQTRFGQTGRKTPVRVTVELTPKAAPPPPATMPWPPPGPTSFNFDSAVPLRSPERLDRTLVQIWSSDFNTTINWNYPRFTLSAPGSFQDDNSPSLTVAGTVDSASKLLTVNIDARKGSSTSYHLFRISLRDLPCSYREDSVGTFYYYTCEVSGDKLRSDSSSVPLFSDEFWIYKFNPTPGTGGAWKLESTATPDYGAINPGAAGLQVQFRGRL